MKSCVYRGQIKHVRYKPVQNAFKYSLFMIYLDLAELDKVFADRRFWSVGKFNLAYLKRADHFGDSAISIDQAVRDLVLDKTGEKPRGPIRMLTHLRYFGHCFNPATFYYCYDQSGKHLNTVVVEIHNTPWGEVFCYVMGEKESQGNGDGGGMKFTFRKNFHVSPFIDMDITYDWRFVPPAETLTVHMTDLKDGEKLFEADLLLERQEMTGANLSWTLLSYPPMTMKVISAIYWQALRLWLKGAPFYSHPKKAGNGGVE